MSVIDTIILGAIALFLTVVCLTLSVVVVYIGYRFIRSWMKQTDEELFEQ